MSSNAAWPPDVVLLHIGINDLNDNLSAGAGDRATALVNRIFADRPGVTVIMQGLLPNTPGWPAQSDMSGEITTYNNKLRQLQASEQQAGNRFSFVEGPALTSAQMNDGLHPNDSGYALMAQNFSTALDQAYTDHWFTGGPASTSWPTPPDTVRLVNRTPDGGLHNAEGDYAAKRWSTWSDLGATGIKEVTSAATGSVNHIFAIGSDNRVYEKDGDYSTGQWSGWFQPENSPTATTITASSGCGQTVHLVIVGTDGHLYNSDGDYAAGHWNGWTDHGGGTWKRLASATTADNVNHIFALDGNNQLQELDANYRTGNWSSWATPASGFTGTDGTAAANGDTVHLGAIGTDGNWYNAEGNFDASTWTN
ncbi:GDSL-type esterase/lipase family protein [Streptomyces sp. NPDC020192]|uniref:GDSL-type esterase/lipase family protein n=1 Tax=Streptomyces sp. NPDC020192 TaxID=3365066 RepID=UPI00378E1E6F